MRVSSLAFVALLAVAVSGCAVISVVDTAVSVTSTVVGTTVDVAAGAVSAVAGSSSKKEKAEDCNPSDKSEDDMSDDEKKDMADCKANKSNDSK